MFPCIINIVGEQQEIVIDDPLNLPVGKAFTIVKTSVDTPSEPFCCNAWIKFIGDSKLQCHRVEYEHPTGNDVIIADVKAAFPKGTVERVFITIPTNNP